MSITNDVRSYADAAIERGKHVVDQAESRLTEVASEATGLAGKVSVTATEVVDKVQDRTHGLTGKAVETYGELRNFGESLYGRVVALPVVESVTSTVEPYVGQLNGYRLVLTEKVEGLYADLKKNDQMAKVLDNAESVAGVVIGTVQERVVKPVRSMVDGKPATHATSHKPATHAATHKPAAAAKAPTATAKASPAKTAPAKRTAPSRSTAKA